VKTARAGGEQEAEQPQSALERMQHEPELPERDRADQRRVAPAPEDDPRCPLASVDFEEDGPHFARDVRATKTRNARGEKSRKL